MIAVRRRGRLGNWLSQYCFARVLAQRFGCRLEAMPVPGFPGSFVEVAGEEVYGPVVCWHGHWPFDAYSGRRLAMEEFFQAPGQRLTLDGLFLRWELIANAREQIREDWLRVDGAVPPRASGDFVFCLLSSEEGNSTVKRETGKPGTNLAEDVLSEVEIRRLVGTVAHERLYFVTDQPRHSLFTRLRDLRGEVVSGAVMDDFRFIQSFQKIAFCQSTFQWWAAFLSEAREIYFPPCDRGLWGHPEPAHLAHEPIHYGIDLRVDEERYVYDW